jgi:hypothetical protein
MPVCAGLVKPPHCLIENVTEKRPCLKLDFTHSGRQKDKRGIQQKEKARMKKKGTERRVYTKEFKAEAAALAGKREKPISQVAVDLGISETMLRRWVQQARESAGSGPDRRTNCH